MPEPKKQLVLPRKPALKRPAAEASLTVESEGKSRCSVVVSLACSADPCAGVPEVDPPADTGTKAEENNKIMKRPAAAAKPKTAPKVKAKAKSTASGKNTDKVKKNYAGPCYYKNSNRWGIKLGKKEVFSVPWLNQTTLNCCAALCFQPPFQITFAFCSQGGFQTLACFEDKGDCCALACNRFDKLITLYFRRLAVLVPMRIWP